MAASDLTNLADRHQERADRLAECSRQTAFRDSAADLIADAELHAETAAALREAGRPRTATFENTERDRLAWRDRAWKAESERDAALAEVERLIADGQQDAPIVDDATRQEVEALVADQTPHVCPSCDGTGWVEDEGWSAYEYGPPARTRVESDGLVPCGRCGDWHIHRYERTEPTMVVDGWDSEQEARAVELLAAAYLGRND